MVELARGELDEAQHGREPWAGFILRGASAGKWASSGFFLVGGDGGCARRARDNAAVLFASQIRAKANRRRKGANVLRRTVYLSGEPGRRRAGPEIAELSTLQA